MDKLTFREERRKSLLEDLEAATRHLNFANNEVERTRLKRQIDQLEREIQQIDDEVVEPKGIAPDHRKVIPPLGDSARMSKGNCWAVLAGVNYYEDSLAWGELKVCVEDVEAIYRKLLAADYHEPRIRLLTDNRKELPTRENILDTFQFIANQTEPDDLLLFYYSGHGWADDQDTYLVARNGRSNSLPLTSVELSDVKTILRNAKACKKVIILDACHSGADIRSKGAAAMSAEFIRHVFEQAEGMAILASCKQGEVSYEWRERKRSAFTHFLLEALSLPDFINEKGFATVQDVSRYVTDKVKDWAGKSNKNQTPTLECRTVGDIILADYRKSEI